MKVGSFALKFQVRHLAPITLALLIAMCATILLPQGAKAQSVLIPNFWDPNERFVKPDFSARQRLKFLTTTDFPPFNFIDRKKRLSGFHIDLARAICAELDMLAKCQIQALPWDELDAAMEKGEGDAIIAGLAVTAESRARYNFSRPFLQIPGRFVARREAGGEPGLAEPVYEALFRKTVGVVENSGHQGYFEKVFGQREFKTYPTRQLAFNALKTGEIDAVFTDALSASFWLASATADDCCVFAGGPYLSEEFFGHGLAIAANKDDQELAVGFDYALKQINDKEIFKELYLRYFPLGLF
jgi:polar amino acid transport system substrate-binding protein